MPLRYTQRILDHLAHALYQPSSASDIARDMRIESDERAAFRDSIAQLVEEGKISQDEGGFISLPNFGDEVVGWFRLNARGFGFVRPETPYRDGDLFIPRGSVRDAVSGDKVRAEVIHQAWRGKAHKSRSEYVGRILEVLERGQDNFVGVLVKRKNTWLVKPDGKSLHHPVVIRDPHVKNAREGDKVVIELVHYPEDDYHAEGVITKVLGEAGKPDVETQAVIAAHGLRTEFPEETQSEARDAARLFEQDGADPLPDREDLTDMFIFTIDPPDAKDFDDAISIAYDEKDDEWTLGVHIADVSTFVTRDSALNQEGHARGNSVYLPRLVIPMLPETLSNGVCSLQEGVPRWTKSAFITFDYKGRVITQRFASTIIQSNKRLTYLEAQALIDGNQTEARKHARTEPNYSDELINQLRLCDQLAKILQKRRRRDGMIVLNLPEVELVFDDDGHVIDAVPEDDAYTHTIIEMFMVEANEAVARCFDSLNVPVLRRIHPDPVHGDLAELQMYGRAAGVKVPEQPTRHDLQRILDATRDTPAGRALHFAVLRTLSKATYSPAMIGHFALASDHYAHFTSPIRRYPDLALHRALQAYLDATDNGKNIPGGKKRRQLGRQIFDDTRTLDEGELIILGQHCTDTENEAEQAERELRDFLVMQFLKENHLGDEFTGVITGVTSSGVFVSIERFLVEGLARMRDLPQSPGRPDRWEVDESSGRFTARRSGASIGIGDIITVQIINIDLASRLLDLMITQFPEPSEGVSRAETQTRRKNRSEKSNSSRKGKRKGYKQGRRGKRNR